MPWMGQLGGVLVSPSRREFRHVFCRYSRHDDLWWTPRHGVDGGGRRVDAFRSQTFLVLLASGLAAGILGFAFARRSAEAERMSMTPSRMMMGRLGDLGDTELGKLAREFLTERVIPEMKPVMVDLLKEFEQYADRYFRRAEKAIKAI